MDQDTTSTTTGTTAGTGGENTATTGQTSGTTANGTGTQTQNQTSQVNTGTGTGTTTGTTAGQEVQTPIDSLPKDIQDYIHKLREDKKVADKKAKEEQTSKTKAEEAKLLEQNNYKALLDKRDVEVATLQKDLAELQRTVLVAKVVSNHKLPAELAKLITGETEAELVESATLLAKHLKPTGVNTEGGKGSGSGSTSGQKPGTTSGQGQNQNNNNQAGKTYSFQKPGEVAWPI
jgi:hypothetical protein